MSGSWDPITFENDGAQIEIYDVKSAQEVVDSGLLKPDTYVLLFENGRQIKKHAFEVEILRPFFEAKNIAPPKNIDNSQKSMNEVAAAIGNYTPKTSNKGYNIWGKKKADEAKTAEPKANEANNAYVNNSTYVNNNPTNEAYRQNSSPNNSSHGFNPQNNNKRPMNNAKEVDAIPIKKKSSGILKWTFIVLAALFFVKQCTNIDKQTVYEPGKSSEKSPSLVIEADQGLNSIQDIGNNIANAAKNTISGAGIKEETHSSKSKTKHSTASQSNKDEATKSEDTKSSDSSSSGSVVSNDVEKAILNDAANNSTETKSDSSPTSSDTPSPDASSDTKQ